MQQARGGTNSLGVGELQNDIYRGGLGGRLQNGGDRTRKSEVRERPQVGLTLDNVLFLLFFFFCAHPLEDNT